MSQLTQPLGFRRFLKTQPQGGFDLLPFFDIVLIALIVALNSSRFVTAPGASIDLVRSNDSLSSIATPKAVLTVDRNELYFFGGQKIANGTLEAELMEYVQSAGDSHPVLLIKADTSISTESLFHLFEIAKKAGFTNVHLAAEEAHPTPLRHWSTLER